MMMMMMMMDDDDGGQLGIHTYAYVHMHRVEESRIEYLLYACLSTRHLFIHDKLALVYYLHYYIWWILLLEQS